MNKLLIIGAAGFLGRAITRYFSQHGWDVYGVDRDPASIKGLKEYAALELPHPLFDELLTRWQPHACIHAAGRASVPLSMQDPASDFRDGPVLTFYLLDSLRHYVPQCSFVFLSSAAVYGNPLSLPVTEEQTPAPISAYGYHKQQSEIICREHSKLWNMKTSSVRIFSAYGPGLRRQVIWDIVNKALTQFEVRLQGTGQESRDFIHVDDIAFGLKILVDKSPMQGDVYNLASGQETYIEELAALVLKQLDCATPPIFSGELPHGTPQHWRADISQIGSLGFAPQIKLEQGIKEFVAWCRREVTDL
jgi:UDP-glucose 4-epimerase